MNRFPAGLFNDPPVIAPVPKLTANEVVGTNKVSYLGPPKVGAPMYFVGSLYVLTTVPRLDKKDQGRSVISV